MCIKQTHVFAVDEGARPKDEATTKVSSVPKGRKTEREERTDKCTCLKCWYIAYVIFTKVSVHVSEYGVILYPLI